MSLLSLTFFFLFHTLFSSLHFKRHFSFLFFLTRQDSRTSHGVIHSSHIAHNTYPQTGAASSVRSTADGDTVKRNTHLTTVADSRLLRSTYATVSREAVSRKATRSRRSFRCISCRGHPTFFLPSFYFSCLYHLLRLFLKTLAERQTRKHAKVLRRTDTDC